MIEFKLIDGFTGYRVGNDGSIWSRWSKVSRGLNKGSKPILTDRWHALKPIRNSRGYCQVNLKSDGGIVKRNILIHQIALRAFVGPKPDGMEACHGDGNRTNNHIANLRWDTRRNNHADKIQHGTDQRGERHPCAKLKATDVAVIRQMLLAGNQKTIIAKRFGVSRCAVSDIAAGRTWTTQ